MAETLRERLIRSYAYMIYWDGTLTLATSRENYRNDIVVYAANYFSNSIIEKALEEGRITQGEYEETMALKPPTEEEPATE